MTASSNPDPNSGGDRNSWQLWLRRAAIGSGLVMATVVTGTVIARYFVYRRLGPIVETSLGTLIGRPVEIGPITGFSLTGITIDGAAIPPTVDDPDYAKVPEVSVGFNPVRVLIDLVRDRDLPITLTFTDPQVYIEEDAAGHWVDLDLQPQEAGPISLRIGTINAVNATVTGAPYPQSLPAFSPGAFSPGDAAVSADEISATVVVDDGRADDGRADDAPVVIAQRVVFSDIDAIAHLRDDNRYLDADVSGVAAGGGEFDIKANADLKRPQVKGNLRTREMQVAQFSDLLPIPGRLDAGALTANLTVTYDKDDQLPEISGTAEVDAIAATIDLLPQPITDVNSILRFSGQTATLEQTSLAYGEVEVVASGAVGVESGYNLSAQVPTVTLDALQQTAGVELPIDTSGAIAADLDITGPLQRPFIQGTVRNPDPIQVDRLVADTVRASFSLTPTLLTIRQLTVEPQVGGQITGTGQVNLQDSIGILLDAEVEAVPSDAIAALYNLPLPDTLRLGSFNSTIEVFGDVSDLQAIAQWSLPESTYPSRGDVRYGDGVIRVRNTVVDAPGGGTGVDGIEGRLTADANVFLAEDRWDAQVNAQTLDVNPLVPQAKGQLTSDVSLSGTLSQLTPEAIALAGTATLADAQVVLDPEASTPILDRGDWQTAFRWIGSGVEVERFTAPGVRADGVIQTNLNGPLTPNTLIRTVDLNVAVDAYDLSRLQAFLPTSLKTRLEQELQPRLNAPLYPQGTVEFVGQLTGPLTQLQADGTAQLNNLAIANLGFAPRLSGPVTFGLGNGGRADLTGGGDRIYARLDERYLPSDFEIRAGELVATGELTAGDRLLASIQQFDLASLGIRPLDRADLGPLRGVVNVNAAANLANLANPQVDAKVAIAQPGLGTVRADVFTGEIGYTNGQLSLANGYFCLPPSDTAGAVSQGAADVSSTETETGPASGADGQTPPQMCADKSVFEVAAVVDVPTTTIRSSQLTIQRAQVQDILTTLQWYDINDAAQWFNFSAPDFDRQLASASAIDTDAITLPSAPLISNNDSITDQLEFFNQWMAQWQGNQRDREAQFTLPSLQTLDGHFAGTINVAGSPQAGFTANFDLAGEDWRWGPYLNDATFVVLGAATPEAIAVDQAHLTTDSARVALEGDIGLSQPGSSTLMVSNVPVPLIQGVAQQFVPQLRSVPIAIGGTLDTTLTLDGTVFNPTIDGVAQVDAPTLNQQPLERMGAEFSYAQAMLEVQGAIVAQGAEQLLIEGVVPYAPTFFAITPRTDQLSIRATVRDEGLRLVNLLTQDQVVWESGAGEVNVVFTGTLENSDTLKNPQIDGTVMLQDGQISSPFLTQPVTALTGRSEFDLGQLRITDPFQAQLGGGTVTIAGQLPLFSPLSSPAATTTTSSESSQESSQDSSQKSLKDVAQALSNEAAMTGTAKETGTGTTNGLLITLDRLSLPLRNLLSAEVDGTVTVGGAAIAPVIGGVVDVFDGRVDVRGLLSSRGQRDPALDGTGDANDPSTTSAEPAPNPALDRITLDNFVVRLQDTLRIARNPFFELETLGTLTIGGTAANPTANGDIVLDSGWINLFATQFRLNRNDDNVAQFRPDRSITNPTLNVSMRSTVREVDRTPVPPSSPFGSSEVIDQSTIPTFGGLQSVEITARVDGSAQHLLAHLSDPNSPSPNPLTLSSDPSRSERQIVALLGGEFLNALESGNTGLALASYVGSGFVAGLGNQIANGLGLSEFSIFPTSDPSGDSPLPITIGVEAGIDLIPRTLSFNILEILDGTTNPQFGLEYQLSDRWQLRGSTDLSDDNRAIIEFRTDF